MSLIQSQEGPIRDSSPEYIAMLNNLSFRYDKNILALQGINLHVSPGEFVAVVGPSGSGKTSLLRCIAGKLTPLSGEIKLKGKVANIYQDLRLVSQRSAFSNVLHGCFGRSSLFGSLLYFPHSERQEASDLLRRVGINGQAKLPLYKLSGGEKQRVAIARALMCGPSVLLADEPVSSLDRSNADRILSLLRDLAREHKLAVICVLHDEMLAKNFADRIIRLENGRITKEIKNVPSITKAEVQTEKHPGESVFKRSSTRKICIFAAVFLLFIWSLFSLNLPFTEMGDSLSRLGSFLVSLTPTSLSEFNQIPWKLLFFSLLETINMAVVSTILGIAISFPLSALAARRIGLKWLQGPTRFALNVIRTVPSLIWALLCVAALGLGPGAGIVALVAYSVGYLSKFFYEAFEGVEQSTPEALSELGASGLQKFLHAVWPAAQPAVLSSSIFMLEYNVRAASVLGVVDAGGIGFYIKQYIDFRFFPAALAGLFMILLVVLVLDVLSSRVRSKLVSRCAV